MIELITREGCVYCTRAKNLLQNAGLSYIETKIGVDLTRDEVLDTYPEAKLLPICVIDGTNIGSYDELFPWVSERLSKKDTHDSAIGMDFSS